MSLMNCNVGVGEHGKLEDQSTRPLSRGCDVFGAGDWHCPLMWDVLKLHRRCDVQHEVCKRAGSSRKLTAS